MRNPATPSNRRAEFDRLLAERILVLDGGWGTMLQSRGLAESDFRGERFAGHSRDLQGNNEVLVLTRPEVIEEIHHGYFAAGADIAETNTFNSNRISQADYGMEDFVAEMNRRAAGLAIDAARAWTEKTPEKPRFVAGAVGPTNKTLSLSPDVNDPSLRSLSFDELHAAYLEQIAALLEAGVDLLLIETIFDTLNAKAAIAATKDVFAESGRELPVMISVTITDKSGRTLSGQTIDAFWVSIAHANPVSVGLNCSLGATEMRPYVSELAAIASTAVSCYPNAGLPNAFGEYDEGPDTTSGLLREFAESGLVNIVGGCCGTNEDHIRAIAEAVAGLAPRPIPERKTTRPCFSGLEVYTIGPDVNFTMIGERTNVTGSRRFANLIKKGDHTSAVEVALHQVRGGANLLDVNLDEGMLDSEQEMTRAKVTIFEPTIAGIHGRQDLIQQGSLLGMSVFAREYIQC